MSFTISNVTGEVQLDLTAYKNCDDVQLFWCSAVSGKKYAPIPDCLGFSIERQRKEKNGQWGKTEILRNRVGFTDNGGQVADGSTRTELPTMPSTVWPFQCFEWTDHGATNGETVRYRVAAVKLPDGGTVGTSLLVPIADTGWTDPIEVSAECGEISAYFNRGFVISQFMARLIRKEGWKLSDIKKKTKELEEPARRFLSGELRTALLNLLDEAIENPDLNVYAALYELSDEELVRSLTLLRGRAHVVLANGSNKSGDGNSGARTTLNRANVDVRDRMLSSKGLGHNKFVVLVRASEDKALKAWTGSTNWSSSGLCTQVNNGILFDDKDVAHCYYEQWSCLADAGDSFPKDLVAENANSPRCFGKTDVWFTCVRRTSKNNEGVGSDIQALIDTVEEAKKAILYVMFQPGEEPLCTILKKADSLYVRGVVSIVPSTTEEKFTLNGIDKSSTTYKTSLVQPEGIASDFSAWLREVTRAQFLYPFEKPGIGHAITHSKMIIVDPFDSKKCAVITGSHNFSKAASEKNDENFVIVRGNQALAEAYAVAAFSTYAHYRWRAFVKEKLDAGEQVWSHLSDQPAWQSGYLTQARKKHLSLWCR